MSHSHAAKCSHFAANDKTRVTVMFKAYYLHTTQLLNDSEDTPAVDDFCSGYDVTKARNVQIH
jgi:hypothetical protein